MSVFHGEAYSVKRAVRRLRCVVASVWCAAAVFGIHLASPEAITAVAAAGSDAAAPTIVVMGDSLSAGYGIDLDRDWVSLLQQRLVQSGYDHKVVNASVSGDTTDSGRQRIAAVLERQRPDVVVIELGGNDGLRGLPTALVEENLQSMIETSQDVGAKVLLIGIKLPPNYGPTYVADFEHIYTKLKEKFGVALVPFLLEGVATQADMMQDDGIHPTAQAQSRIVDNVWPVLEPLLTPR
jgi:acyl-CoA thioesterase-1